MKLGEFIELTLWYKHISKADVVFIADSDYTNHCAFNVQLVRFLHCFVTFLQAPIQSCVPRANSHASNLCNPGGKVAA